MSEIYESPKVQKKAKEARAKVHVLLKNEISQGKLDRGDFVFLDGDVRSYGALKICGYSHSWGEKGSNELYRRICQIISGLYGNSSQFYYCIAGDGQTVFYIFGAPKETLRTIGSSFHGFLQDVRIEENRIMPEQIRKNIFPERTGKGGIITGMPSIPAEAEGTWVNPAMTIASSMGDSRFLVVFSCKAVSEDIIEKQINAAAAEESLAAFHSEMTMQGDELHNLSEKVTIREYQQYQQYLERYEKHLQASREHGAWRVAAHYLAENESEAAHLASVIKAAFGGNNSGPEPLRCTPDPRVTKVIDEGHMFGAVTAHPLGLGLEASGFFNYFTTQLSSDQLASFCMIPDRELPGFYVNEECRFDMTPRVREKAGDVILGDVMQSPYISRPVGKYYFTASDLDRHALVVGSTGGGKSNTIRSLLKTLITEKKLPFMVIESAKSEYWELANYGINVCALQLGTHDAPFRMNPFEPAEKFPLQTHVDSLLATFKAAFEMYPPMPFILEQSVYAVYADYGWDVATGENNRKIKQYPTLADLYWQIPITVEGSAYDKEIKNNVTGSLQTRIRSLMFGGKGRMLNCRKSTLLPELLKKPLVLELENLGDDDIKSFVMGLLMTLLYEVRRVQSAGRSRPLSHLLVIEEAHRLLKRVEGAGESGDVKAASVAFFCNMLSEIRSYGQGILIADQSPEKLAEDAVRNTNLKIVHRMVDLKDREIIAGAMHMNEQQCEALTLLSRGVAAVYSEGDHRPRLVKMPLLEADERKSRENVLQESKVNPVFKTADSGLAGAHSACRYCSNFASGGCKNSAEKMRCTGLVTKWQTKTQCLYYKKKIDQLGPAGQLIWGMVKYAVQKETEASGVDKKTAEEQLKSLTDNQWLCIGGLTLSRITGLDENIRDLGAAHLYNWLQKNKS